MRTVRLTTSDSRSIPEGRLGSTRVKTTLAAVITTITVPAAKIRPLTTPTSTLSGPSLSARARSSHDVPGSTHLGSVPTADLVWASGGSSPGQPHVGTHRRLG